MTPIENILARLHNVRKTGAGQWLAYCPAHEADGRKHKSSLSVGLGDDGRVLLACHAGCQVPEIVAALGLTMADLFESNTATTPRAMRVCPILPAWIRADPAWSTLKAPARWLLHVVAEHCRDQVDADGSLGYSTLGPSVLADTGMSRRTALRSAEELHAAGFLVKVSQGGQLTSLPGKSGPARRRYRSNLYGVPGRRGALDAVAVAWTGKGQVSPGMDVCQNDTHRGRVPKRHRTDVIGKVY